MLWTKITIMILLGLTCFLIGITLLSKLVKHSFGKKAEKMLAKYTKNVFYSLCLGIILTAILNSSSAVIILTIVFINAGSLNFKKAIGIILGSNIGTTFSSQLIAIDIYQYSFLGLIIGFLIIVFSKSIRAKVTGKAIFYVSVIFFGLFIMEQSTVPLKDSYMFSEWMQSIENNHMLGAIIGGLITVIIQSSSATVAIAIIMTKQNIISSTIGISIMLGAELGTCFDTALATIGGTKEGFKAALFHATFNLTTILLALTFYDPFITLVESITDKFNIGSIIPNAHMIFNIGGVLFILPIILIIERLDRNTISIEGKNPT